MTTLADHSPISHLARILHAAMATGGDAWDSPETDRPTPREKSASEPALSKSLLELFRLLSERKVNSLLVGGVALLRYIEGRNTDDLDLLMPSSELARLPEIHVHDRDLSFAHARFKEVRVDVLLAENSLFKQVLAEQAVVHQFQEADVRCATVDGLVVLKLYALPALYEQGNMQRVALYEGDLTMLYQRHRPNLNAALETLRPHVTESQLVELSRIVAEIHSRVARMDRHGRGER